MLRTMNVIDLSELKRTFEHFSIKDNTADKQIKRIDQVLDAISDFRIAMDEIAMELTSEEFTENEINAINQSLMKAFKRAVDFKCNSILK